jgi:aspartokinase-like uncharacterized kinase
MLTTMKDVHVIKLGGSLLDLPDLVGRFEAFRAAEAGGAALLVVGGAESAEVVRFFDRHFNIGEERGHWLAVRAMQLNAHVVAAALPGCRLVVDEAAALAAWAAGLLAIVDPLEWLLREEAAGIAVPHRWSFTSDSIAAHLATRLKASRLTLLKSTLPRGDCSAGCLAGLGIVDGDFEEASQAVPIIDVVNLRAPDPVGAVSRRRVRG